MDFREKNFNSLIKVKRQDYSSAGESFNEYSFIDLITSEMARENFIYLQSIGKYHCKDVFITERSNLDSYYILYTLSGQGRLLYKEKEYLLCKNQLFFIDCKNYQRYEIWNSDAWDQLWIHAYGGNIENYYNIYIQDGSPVCTLAESSVIPMLMRQLYEIQKPTTRYTEIINSKKMVELLTEIIISKADPNSGTTKIPDYVLAVQQFFELNYADSCTLEYLAKKYAVNQYRLVKEFKKHIGVTPINYLINRRITIAQELLRNTDQSIAEIACLVGISNVNNFIILFKKRTGMTPLVYRKTW